MRPALQRWLAGVVAWTVLALLSASQWAVALGAEHRPVDWGWLLPNRLVDWYSCAVFTPAFFWLVRRYPIDRRRGARRVPLYLLATAVAALGKFVIQRGVTLSLLGQPFPPLKEALARGFISENMAIWCVIAAIHAFEFHRRVREREVLTSRLQARLSEAQLDALASRLHPHFLFNTLQGISTLVYRDPAAADAMLGHLSTLLRRALSRGQGHEVTLREEVAMLEEYLAIVQLRFGDRVAIERTFADDALHALVPQLVLQPLVENAIEHGVARRSGTGHIVIRAAREGEQLRISVADDGPGLARPAAEGVGLGNTRLRLCELYGADGQLSLQPGRSGGLVATISLPFHEVPVSLLGAESVA